MCAFGLSNAHCSISTGEEHPVPLCEGGGELPEEERLWGRRRGRELMTPPSAPPTPSRVGYISRHTLRFTWRTVSHDRRTWRCDSRRGVGLCGVSSERRQLHHRPKPSVPRGDRLETEASALTGVKPQTQLRREDALLKPLRCSLHRGSDHAVMMERHTEGPPHLYLHTPHPQKILLITPASPAESSIRSKTVTSDLKKKNSSNKKDVREKCKSLSEQCVLLPRLSFFCIRLFHSFVLVPSVCRCSSFSSSHPCCLISSAKLYLFYSSMMMQSQH